MSNKYDDSAEYKCHEEAWPSFPVKFHPVIIVLFVGKQPVTACCKIYFQIYGNNINKSHCRHLNIGFAFLNLSGFLKLKKPENEQD
jgi:hypothetical protein